MFFRQLYDSSLAQASYVIGCQATREAIVIDPLRDIGQYLELAKREGLEITHISETHIHADFVSGARELRSATNATLFLSAEGGHDWQYRYAAADGATLVRDGDHIAVGNIGLEVMHTPGHTPEHISFIVTDKPANSGPMGILTGDFVFVGDVGRPDLLERAAKVRNTMVDGAHTLFRSLDRFRKLADHLQVWPGHGAGSACGKALGAVPFSTVGYEKRANWAVAETNEAAFVDAVLLGQPEPPRYFADMKRINRDGPAILGARTRPAAISPSHIIAGLDTPAANAQRWVVDLRPGAEYSEAHVPGTISVCYGRSFSTWLGSLVPIDAEIILLGNSATSGNEELPANSDVQLAARDLVAIGFDNIRGFANANEVLEAWQHDGRQVASFSVTDAGHLSQDPLPTVDVRGRSEWDKGHLPHAIHIPLGTLPERLAELPAGSFVVQCQSGARSVVATSLLHRAGRSDAINLAGGFEQWQQAGLPVEAA